MLRLPSGRVNHGSALTSNLAGYAYQGKDQKKDDKFRWRVSRFREARHGNQMLPGCFPSLVTTTVQPLWNPVQPQSEQRQLIPRASFLLLVPQGVWELSQGLDVPWFVVARVERDDWNNWNLGTFGTCVSLKRFERRIAIERLERLELATAYVKVVSTDS